MVKMKSNDISSPQGSLSWGWLAVSNIAAHRQRVMKKKRRILLSATKKPWLLFIWLYFSLVEICTWEEQVVPELSTWHLAACVMALMEGNYPDWGCINHAWTRVLFWLCMCSKMELGINKCSEELLGFGKNKSFQCVFNKMKAYFLPISPLRAHL